MELITVTVECAGGWSYEWNRHLEYLHKTYGGRWVLTIPVLDEPYAENEDGRQFYLDGTERLLDG